MKKAKSLILRMDKKALKRRFKQLPNEHLKRAAKRVLKDVEKHMRTDGWPLDYGFLVEDIYWKAYGHHLSDYMLNVLGSAKFKWQLSTRNGSLILVQTNKAKRVTKTKQNGKK
jgi:hypothetical protein